MHPTRSPGWLSPLCLWVERRLGQERQRELNKRYLLILLLGSFLLLAYDSATLPARIDTLWSAKLNGDITHASIYTDPVHGHLVAVAVMQHIYDPYLTKLKHSNTRIVMLDRDGREVGDLVEAVDGWVGDLIYLPSRYDPDAVILIPPRYMHGEAHVIEIEGEAARLPAVFDAQIIPGKEANWTFSPDQIDSVQLGEEHLLIGYREEGPSILSAYLYNGTINHLWTKNLRTGEISAHILTGMTQDPMIGVLGSETVWLFSPNGTLTESFNLTDWIKRYRPDELESSGVQVSVDWGHIRWGRGLGGFRVSLRDQVKPNEQIQHLFIAFDDTLKILGAFPVSESGYVDPIFLEGEDKIMMGGHCRDLNGSPLWIRNRMIDTEVADLEGDGSDEILATKPDLVSRTGRLIIYNSAGRVVARGDIRPGRSPVFGASGWSGLGVGDLDGQQGLEILFYSGDTVSLLKPGPSPPPPRLVLEASLASVSLVLLVVILHMDGNRPFQATIRVMKAAARMLRIPGAHAPRPEQGGATPEGTSRARMTMHQAYKLCPCGAQNPVQARVCCVCGRRLKTATRTQAPDLSIRGTVSRIGLVLGIIGLGLLWASPMIWGVEPSGLLVPLRQAFSALSPAVPYASSAYLLFLLGLVGLSLVYLEKWALPGAGIILFSSTMLGWLLVSGESISRLPLVLLTASGILQPTQMVMARGIGLGSRTGRACLVGLVVAVSLAVFVWAYYRSPRVDAFLGEYGLREADRPLMNGVANVTLIAGNKGKVAVTGLELVVWIDPPCILRMEDATELASGQYSYKCQPLPPGSFATLLMEIECPDPSVKSAVIHVDLLHRGLTRRKLELHFK